MSTNHEEMEMEAQAREFMGGFFGLKSLQPQSPFELHGTLTRRNQPEFHADAPWRLEPDLDSIALLFLVREGNLQPPGLGPWLLDEIHTDQLLSDGHWYRLFSYSPAQLPGVDATGHLDSSFWTFRTRIPLSSLQDVGRGDVARLRVVFDGRFPPGAGDEPATVCRYLHVYLATDPLPLSRAATGSAPRQWFYGDTHYHSDGTNNVWECGNPVRDARDAGIAIGLDWLVVTDHSCDLDDPDDGPGSPTRWERLKTELAKPSISDDRFRCILGEEITVRKGRFGYMHVLLFGGLDQLIEGGFWHDGDWIVKRVADGILDIIVGEGGYPDDIIERVFDPVHRYDQMLQMLPPETLAFAAHPYVEAQPPFWNGKWEKEQLTHPRLAGHEFWNGRTRHKTQSRFDPTDNPFEEPEWNDPTNLAEADESRVKRLKKWVDETWSPMLEDGVDEWTVGDSPPMQRPVFLAGSDAHGDFNYAVGVGWDYKQHNSINDNALGRARTVIFLPHHQSTHVPDVDQILAALRKGSAVVTDGPVIAFSLQQDGQIAHMGDVLHIAAGQPELKVVFHTSLEFGAAEQVELITYVKGDRRQRIHTPIQFGPAASVTLEGDRGFLRLAADTVGRLGERFCCFTNPVWFWNPGARTVQLRVLATQQ